MTVAEATDPPTDGRRARRARNTALAIDTALTLFTEENLVPSIEQVAARAGLSLRSLYRYFNDTDELISMAIAQAALAASGLAEVPSLGSGPLGERIRSIVTSRVRLHDSLRASYRATVHHASTIPALRVALDEARRNLQEQLEQHFALELDELSAADRLLVAAACEAACQFETTEVLRHGHDLGIEDTITVMSGMLAAALRGPSLVTY